MASLVVCQLRHPNHHPNLNQGLEWRQASTKQKGSLEAEQGAKFSVSVGKVVLTEPVLEAFGRLVVVRDDWLRHVGSRCSNGICDKV